MIYEKDEVKNKTEVLITFLDGSTMLGHFFTKVTQRVCDVLNDGRDFIPFEDVSGDVRLLMKGNIRDVHPTQQENGGRDERSAHIYSV